MSNDEGERIPLSFSDLPSHSLFAQDPIAELYHYTTLQGAYGIITTKQLWLTKIQYLNDVTELRYATPVSGRKRRIIAWWVGTVEPAFPG